MTETPPQRTILIVLIPLVQGFLLLFFFIALITRDGTAAFFVLVIISALAGAKLWTAQSAHRVHIRLSIDRTRLFPGESATFRITVSNRKILPVLVTITADDTPGLITTGNTSRSWSGCLLSFREKTFERTLIAEKRGVYHTGHLHISTGDLCGLFHRTRHIDESREIIVYPRLRPLPPAAPARRSLFDRPGVKSLLRDPLYPVGTRDYHQSQPARHIHWKASARHNRLQEKVFDESAGVAVLIACDVGDPSVTGPAFESALEYAASFAALFHTRGVPVGFITNGRLTGTNATGFMPVTAGRTHLSSVLEILARTTGQSLDGDTLPANGRIRLNRSTSCLSIGDPDRTAENVFFSFCRAHRIPVTTVPPVAADTIGGTAERHP